MAKNVQHKGTIISCGNGNLTVRITPTSDECVSCALSKMCAKSETLEVPYSGTDDLTGKKVTISIGGISHTKALLLMMVIPLLLMIATLFVLIGFNISELVASLISLSVLAVWYLIVFLLRDRLLPKNPLSIASFD